jgi:four helix bundle protein
MIRDVTDLEVYTLSLELLPKVYLLTNRLPPQHKRIRYQLNEAAEKIAPQIAEGFGKKKSPKEFCRFLSMAIGSSDEVITHIREIVIVSKFFTRIDPTECEKLISEYKVLSRKLNKLHSTWQKFD